MSQEIKVIKSAYELENNIGLLINSQPKGVDSETTGLNPLTADLRLLQISDEDNTLVIDVRAVGKDATAHFVRPILEDKTVVKSFHNAKFDTKFIKHHLKIDVQRIFDSYLASILCEGGIRQARGYHGLGQTLKRYTGRFIDKSEQVSNWDGELSESQLLYAAKDAQEMLPLRTAMIERLRQLSLFRCAQIEFEAVLPVVWLELCGFYMDFEQWKAVAEHNLARSYVIADEIFKEMQSVIPQGSLFEQGGFNLNSIPQVRKYFTDYGIEMPDSTKEAFLQPLAEQYPLIGKLLEYRGCTKHATSFGEKWEEFISTVDGRIHADFNQIGAEDTGRFSCSNPNLQQIPKEDLFRNCFKAEGEDSVLISGDYSQIELRILADISRDKVAIAEFAAGKDFHTATAERINRTRSLAKNCNFAIPYGAGPTRVAATAQIGLLEAEMLMDSYFKAFPNFKSWINKQKRDVLRKKYARTVSGRIARFIFDENDGQQRSQAQRNAVNMPIQGSSADILKRSLRIFYDNTADYRDRIKLVNIVHDEINVESPKNISEEISAILTESMIAGAKEFLKEVVVKVDVKIQKQWQK